MQSPPQSKTKIPTWLIAGAGCLFVSFASLCCLAAALFLFNRDPQTSAEQVGTVQVDASGGSFDLDGIAIRIPPGFTQQDLRLTVYRDDSAPNTLDEEVDLGPAFTIRGPLDAVNGEIEVTLQVDEDLLDSAGDGGALVKEETGYSISNGEVQHVLVLPTRIDREAGTAAASLPLHGGGGVGALPHGPAASLLNALSGALAAQNPPTGEVLLRFRPKAFQDKYPSDNFILSSVAGPLDNEMARQTINILNLQHSKITQLGFKFNPDEKINVTVMDLGNDAGIFAADKRGAGYCIIEINSKFFKDENAFVTGRKELTATLGHELLHQAQFIMDPRWAFTKAMFPGPMLWMDEAVATWFEPLAVDDPTYVPQNAKNNVNFISRPLLSPPSKDAAAQEHGYGASFFIQFLVSKYGEQFPGEIYQQISAGAGSASVALARALQPYATELDVEWREFVQIYPIKSWLFNEANTPDVWKVALTAQGTGEAGQYQTTFLPYSRLQPHITQVENGELPTGNSAAVELKYTLKGMTADAFYLSIDPGPDSQQAFQAPGMITITTDAPADAGVMLLAYSASSKEYISLAGAPHSFLSARDPNSNQGSQLTIDGFGQEGGGSLYQRLLIIPFNSHPDPEDPGGALPITIRITYWGQGIPPVADDPTAEPPPETPVEPPAENPPPAELNHACAGMTLEKMKTPLGHASNCWRTCFAIGSGEHSDAEMQSCIDSNQ